MVFFYGVCDLQTLVKKIWIVNDWRVQFIELVL